MMMNRLIALPIALAFVCGLVLAQPRIVINEFAYDDTSTDDVEFVELYNADTVPVDISGWRLESGDLVSGDNNPDYTIPGAPGSGTVVLQPGQFYVIGSELVPNVNLVVGANNLFENDNEWTALKMPDGMVVDAIAYETNKAPDLTTWVPANIIPQLGRGIWGNYITLQASTTTDDTLLSLQRWRDGLDTNDNGRDFGHMPWTPGASNNTTPTPFSQNFNALNVYDLVPNLSGSFRAPRVIDPTQCDTTYATTPNPNCIPASPDGGNAMIGWDWAGGGNMATSTFAFQNRAGYDLLIYIDNSMPIPGELESWMIGLMGTCDSFYNIPFRCLVNASGPTGVGWMFKRANTANDPMEVKLRLVDAGPGGDSNPGCGTAGTMQWTTFGEIDLSNYTPGWYRLRLEVKGDKVVGTFSNPDGSGAITFSGTTEGCIGAFYIGYREAYTTDPFANPVRIDALSLFIPTDGDVDGNGCVDDADLLEVLFAFGATGCTRADVNGDGVVDDADLLTVLFDFGSGC
ncbi:hypothetical protein HRbin15_00169 [bacterium HR15]|nr:hypothetical protein HRbin15_00169 [bacterium HR15]